MSISCTAGFVKRTRPVLLQLIFAGMVIALFYSGLTRASGQKTTTNSRTVSGSGQWNTPVSNPQGVDVSHYQGVVNWSVVAEEIDFVFIKATEGEKYVDPRFHANMGGAKQGSLQFAPYHFYLPNEDPAAQAKHFIDQIKDYQFSLPPVLDIEVAPTQDEASFHQNIKTWLQLVADSSGCTPIIYSNKSFWQRYLKQHFSHYPLWISDYTTDPESIENMAWLFWQYSQQGQVDGIGGPVDKSIFKGSVEDLTGQESCHL